MVEEEQNQHLDDDEDGISKFPDCLLGEILSRLPETKYAVRTGALFKRWKHVWHAVPNLDFVNSFQKSYNPQSNARFFSFVDETLTLHRQWKLKKFRLYSGYNLRLESHVNDWIRYAVNCNIEELDLALWDLEYCTTDRDFPLDQFVFMCSSFTHLTLSGWSFNPTGAISWKNLRSLCISFLKLDGNDLIENILSGSPVLQTLELIYCYGDYRWLDITSKSVKKLVFTGYIGSTDDDYGPGKLFEINAPNILSLTIQGDLWLRKLLLLSVSSLVEAHLNYTNHMGVRGTGREEEETLKGLILNLLHVKDLRIGPSCLDLKWIFFW
ncbi:F-box/LRR-repeat protein 25-like [Bidens hawaiensis]|uniref:F-box/LRR-repeat protein 25-like n=1 Tax=Bidens hawaiensis TaxID=980011 RepID=UPI0040497DCE